MKYEKFVKFLLVGGLNTLFGYSIFALCIYINFHYTLAVLISTILGVIFNFKTIGNIVFKNNNNKLLWKFVCVYIITYLISVGFLKLCLICGFINMYINSIILIIPNSLITYTLMKKFVFS
ncbi:GtrA family protein [bacterium]|nr:GtrA family protein [bacterium]